MAARLQGVRRPWLAFGACPPLPAIRPAARRPALRVCVGLLVLLATAFRLAYLWFDCPLDLSPDEAHYWHWSLHLDWSYYSKGPAVAWLIRGSCAIFGDTLWAVRLPAVILGAVTLTGLWRLTWCVYRDDRFCLVVVAIALTLPVFHAGSLLMTIDAPFICAWTWALVAAHGLLVRQRSEQQTHRFAANEHDEINGGKIDNRGTMVRWVYLGLLVGLGILAKYTMALFLLSLAMYLLAARQERRQLLQPGFWLAVITAAVSCLPILVWNYQHDWITFAHVGRQAGVSHSQPWRWWGPFEYLAGQGGLLLGTWFAVYLVAMYNIGRDAVDDVQNPLPSAYVRRFLWWMSAPMFFSFLAFSVRTKVQLNWPVAAYLSGLVLAAGPAVCWWSNRWWRKAMSATALLGVAATAALLYSDALYPLLARVAPQLNARKIDPTCRLKGWRTLAAEIDDIRAQHADQQPLLATATWAWPGALAFYCHGRPEVYNFALAVGGRHSQYDYWRPNPLFDPEHFRGRTFIYVGEINDAVRHAFDEIGPTRLVVCRVHDLPVASWQVTVCRGFRGFSDLKTGQRY